jgi:DeoR/GlpR family transcriptional regulator of sugar metabolism
MRFVQNSCMLLSLRQQRILDELARERQVIATALSKLLGVSEDTIRRDLRELADAGLLRRVHGGALPVAPAEAVFARRMDLGVAGKRAIGRHAAAMIRPGQTVVLDGGTTALQVAQHLPPDLEATIVTHSPSIAVALVEHRGVDVVLIGGRLFKHSIVTMGAAAVESIRRLRADLFFVGVTGVHPDAGLTTGDYEEAAVKRLLSRSAAETYVLASSEKIGVISPHQVLGFADIAGIITDAPAPALGEAGVVVAEDGGRQTADGR